MTSSRDSIRHIFQPSAMTAQSSQLKYQSDPLGIFPVLLIIQARPGWEWAHMETEKGIQVRKALGRRQSEHEKAGETIS